MKSSQLWHAIVHHFIVLDTLNMARELVYHLLSSFLPDVIINNHVLDVADLAQGTFFPHRRPHVLDVADLAQVTEELFFHIVDHPPVVTIRTIYVAVELFFHIDDPVVTIQRSAGSSMT